MQQMLHMPHSPVLPRLFLRLYRTFLCTLAAFALLAAVMVSLLSLLNETFAPKAEVIATPVSPTISLPDRLLEAPHALSYYDSIEPITPPDIPISPDALPIIVRDLSCADDPLTLRNETAYSPNLSSLLSAAILSQEEQRKPPTVLILHTHATECYAEGDSYLPGDTDFRSEDTTRNMVAIGQAMTEVLTEAGITVYHATLLHDAASYNASYANAAQTVRDYLARYPEIDYILDVHRDAITDDTGNVARCVSTIDGKETAQIMLVVGTDERGADHPEWETNLAFALSLQSALCDRYPGLMRAINLRGAAFNQQYSPGYLLVEIGASGNTRPQALRAARLFASVFGDIIFPKEF